MKEGKKRSITVNLLQRDTTNNEIEDIFSYNKMAKTTNTMQPLRWKFNQSHKQLSSLSPDLNC